MTLTRLGIAVFAAATLAGPSYTVDGYDPVRNLVSELAAQQTPNNVVMIAAFVVLGAAIAVDGLRPVRSQALPFVAFGISMALAGVFGHKPIDPGLPFSAFAHQTHSALATAAGISITIGLVWHGLRVADRARRIEAWVLAVLCFALPMSMLALPAYQGLIQRVMYAVTFAWLWRWYPRLPA